MKIALRLAHRASAQRPTTAVFLLGAEPHEWLRKIESWKFAHDALRFLLLGSANREALLSGALVLLPQGEKAPPALKGIAYGQVGERLYLPVESTLEPVLEAREIDKLLRQCSGDDGQAIYVWSPLHGLTQFLPSEIRRVSDLVSPPRVTQDHWIAPPLGEMRPTKLTELAPRQAPDPQSILEQGRDGIGGLAGEKPIDTPSPKESGPVKRGLQSIAGAAAGAIGAAPFLPPSWAESLKQWAQQMIQRSADSLSAMRNRELARLMNLLEKNPDEGLQYAIPLRPDQAPRGLSRPGGNLMRRDVNFSSWGMGSGAADPWDIGNYEAELLRRYHALALREIQLGRFRRAAYIYAELLGNLELAATTLEQGGDYREAAVIYEKRLNRPQQAADAYLRGGLWTEAIQLLEQLQQYERVGDTYSKLGETERARLAYHRALEQRRQANDYLDAVRILEVKLEDLDGAIDLSLTGWPETQQAKACLQKHFELLEKTGRHEEAARRLKAEAGAKIASGRQLDLMDAMAQMAQRHSDAKVRATAKDRTRFLASRLLKVKGQPATEEIISAVQRLEPNEVVFGRDCQRYLKQVGRRPSDSHTPALLPSAWSPAQKISLPSDVHWMSAISSGKCFYAAGRRNGTLIVARGAWSGGYQLIPRPWFLEWPIGPILLAIEPVAARKAKLLVHPISFDSALEIEPQTFPVASGDLAFAQSVGGSKVFTSQTVAMGYLNSDALLVVDKAGATHFVLKYFLIPRQELLESSVLEVEEELTGIPSSCVIDGNLHLGIGKTIRSVSQSSQERLETYQTITSLVGGRRNGRNLLVALHKEGASLFGGQEHENAYIAADLVEPVACVTTCGLVVLAARGGILAYEFTAQGTRLIWTHGKPTSSPIAAISTGVARQFGLLLENGEMRVFTIR